MSVKNKEFMKARETEAGIKKIFTLIIKAIMQEKGQIDMRIMRDPQWIDPIMKQTAIEMTITRKTNIRLKCIEDKVIQVLILIVRLTTLPNQSIIHPIWNKTNTATM